MTCRQFRAQYHLRWFENDSFCWRYGLWTVYNKGEKVFLAVCRKKQIFPRTFDQFCHQNKLQFVFILKNVLWMSYRRFENKNQGWISFQIIQRLIFIIRYLSRIVWCNKTAECYMYPSHITPTWKWFILHNAVVQSIIHKTHVSTWVDCMSCKVYVLNCGFCQHCFQCS